MRPSARSQASIPRRFRPPGGPPTSWSSPDRDATAQTNGARGARPRRAAARDAGIPALTAEVESAVRVLNTPAARLIERGEERPLLLDDVEALLASKALVVDACRHAVRDAGS